MEKALGYGVLGAGLGALAIWTMSMKREPSWASKVRAQTRVLSDDVETSLEYVGIGIAYDEEAVYLCWMPTKEGRTARAFARVSRPKGQGAANMVAVYGYHIVAYYAKTLLEPDAEFHTGSYSLAI